MLLALLLSAAPGLPPPPPDEVTHFAQFLDAQLVDLEVEPTLGARRGATHRLLTDDDVGELFAPFADLSQRATALASRQRLFNVLSGVGIGLLGASVALGALVFVFPGAGLPLLIGAAVAVLISLVIDLVALPGTQRLAASFSQIVAEHNHRALQLRPEGGLSIPLP